MLLKMAWRNVWRNKARSLIIAASVAIGLFAGVFVLSIYKGMIGGRIQNVIEDEVAHLQLYHPEFKKDNEAVYTIPGVDSLLDHLKDKKEIKAFSERSLAQGMLSTGTGSNGVEIRGVHAAQEKIVSRLDKKIMIGNYLGAGKRNELLIGKKLLDKMNLKVGDKVVLTFTDKDNNITAGAFRISGVYQSSNTPLDERTVYVNKNDLDTLLNIGNGFHEVALLLFNNDDVDTVKQILQKENKNLLVQTWKEASPETELTVSTVDQFSIIIIIIIMLALAFGIINTMLMAILERTRETGMMVALGMNKPRLFVMVLLETIMLTVAGVPLGLLLAWVVIFYTSRQGINVASFAKDVMQQFGYSSIIYPQFPIEKLAGVLLIVFITAIVSAMLPALKALQLRPVEALRK